MKNNILFAILILTLACCSARVETSPTDDQSGAVAPNACEVIGVETSGASSAWQFGDPTVANPDPTLCEDQGGGAFLCKTGACILGNAFTGTCPKCGEFGHANGR